MAFFRRLAVPVIFALGTVAVSVPVPVSADVCQCGCLFADGHTESGDLSCTSSRTCTLDACAINCARLGADFTPPRGARVYECAAASAPAPAPATGAAGGGATAATGGGGAAPSGSAAPAPAGSGATAASGGASAAGGGAGAPTAGSLSSLRFVLPACTEEGNCSLTDIINTGVRFANFLLALSGVIFLGTFLFAGAWLLFFAYDAGAVKKAQGMIVGAFTGIVIIMVAGVAVRFVSASMGVSSSMTELPGRPTTPPAPRPSVFR